MPVRHPLGSLDGGLIGGCFGNSSILGGHSSKADSYHLSAQHPDLDKTTWHEGTDALSEHLEIAVNNALLGIHHTLESEVKAGDKIILMGSSWEGKRLKAKEGNRIRGRASTPRSL